MKCLIVIEIISIHKKWLCEFDLDLTLQENLKSFFQIIKKEIETENWYSEQLIVMDSRTQQILYPYVQCFKLGLYHGIIIYIL